MHHYSDTILSRDMIFTIIILHLMHLITEITPVLISIIVKNHEPVEFDQNTLSVTLKSVA